MQKVIILLVIVSMLTFFSGTQCQENVRYLSHEEALKMLEPYDVTVRSSGGCSNKNVPTCTSLDEIRETTIQNVIILTTASGCDLVITGGTETGHASGTYSHWNGYKVDYRLSDCLNDYITNRFTYIGQRPGDGAQQYESASGNHYFLEGNHWDCVYY